MDAGDFTDTHQCPLLLLLFVRPFPLPTRMMLLQCKSTQILTHIRQHVALIHADLFEDRLYTFIQAPMHELALSHTHSLCFTVLSLRCVGRCVRYTCWRTRFLCVRLNGSGCLTPAASLVWRQVRGGHISAVPSEPLPPCDPSCCHSNG